MAKQLEDFYSCPDEYMSMQGHQMSENLYELSAVNKKRSRQSACPPYPETIELKQKQSAWSKPLLFITVLLCIILIILFVILGMAGWLIYAIINSASNYNIATGVNSATGASVNNNAIEWVDHVATNISQKFPNFTEWAEEIVQNVYQEIANNGQNFTEWSEVLIHNINTAVNKSLTVDSQILRSVSTFSERLMNIINTLSNLQGTSTTTAGVTSDILLVAKKLLVLHNDSTALPTSCKEVQQQQPHSPSGMYILAAANGNGTYETYCNMGEVCGSGGGWTRLAYLDMSDATENCPSPLRLYQSGRVRACGRPVSSVGSCASLKFQSNGISYSQICGRVLGYQYSSTDAAVTNNLNSNYVDGVSITRGSPRQHVWTLISAWSDTHNRNPCNCNQQPQPFIGNNFFCESGNPTSNANGPFFVDDPLWDGQGCGQLELTCCSAPGLPWFRRNYNSTTTDYIELRVCADESTQNEDVTVGLYEIYVK